MQVLATMRSVLFLAALAAAQSTNTDEGAVGLIGYGLVLYEPACAWACLECLVGPLNCSSEGVTDLPTPECQSHNEHYLRTAAFCMKQRCGHLSLAELDKFYSLKFPGDKDALEPPFQSYTQLLPTLTTPTRALNVSEPLTYTAYVPDDQWTPMYDTMRLMMRTETYASTYSLVIIASGFLIPVAASLLLRLLPCTNVLFAYLAPPAFGSKHHTPVLGLGVVPTRGQALFIAYLWIINVVFSAHGVCFAVSPWNPDIKGSVLVYAANRASSLCLANFPLVMLYAGRNNMLLWLTDWSHSTFVLLHRWTGVLCMLHGVVHSLLYLIVSAENLNGYLYAEEHVEMYWQLGIAATVAMVAMCLLAMQPVRQKMYELFLASHVVLAIVALAGSYYHINLKYTSDYGFENWVYMAVAVWVFDRVIRLARTLRYGLKRAYLTPVDDDYYRLDVTGVTASGHVYLHFPSVSLWRFWENHPFSVASVTYRKAVALEKTERAPDSSGIAMFVRKHHGITGLLAQRAQEKGIPVLVEGSYHGCQPRPSHKYPNLVCIAGGVGITGVLPALDASKGAGRALGTRKLYWGVRTMPLVDAVEDMLGGWDGIEVSLAVGERLDLRTVLREIQDGTTVVVCGPSGMADEVRCIVSGMARHGARVQLAVEAFGW